MTKPVPEGYHTLTPTLVVKDARRALEFYEKAFGAERLGVAEMPDGRVGHAEVRIGDSRLMLNDEFPEMGATAPEPGRAASSVWVYVEDADAFFARATAAGAKVLMPLGDQFWGDRMGALEDPFGHRWSVATRKRDQTPEETKARMAAAFKR
ncbi:MAG: VOC family protein [Elusimicrobia bacterium]|nr:VOC family protein [Elusimicrobiota bacterium]